MASAQYSGLGSARARRKAVNPPGQTTMSEQPLLADEDPEAVNSVTYTSPVRVRISPVSGTEH
jgi:hypothetical protein